MTRFPNEKWAGSHRGVFTAERLSGGQPYKSNGKSVYGVDIEMPIGFLPVNGRNVSGIVNIDLDTIDEKAFGKLITERMVQARPGAGGTLVAYAHPVLVAFIAQMNEAQALGNADNGIYSTMFNGVQIVGDWNLLEGTEAPYTVS